MARQAKYGPYNYERTLGTRDYNFSADVDDFVKSTKKRMRALMISATVDLIELVQTPTGKGGKMRVKTGFLRASGQYSLTGMPSGPARGDPDKKYTYKPVSQVALKGFELGQTIWFGWTANYARVREAYDGFLISGVQQWQSIVNKRCIEIRQRSEANATRRQQNNEGDQTS
jgi:hypothetical protein